MSRITKLTPKMQKKIITLVKGGNYYSTACKACGISEATLCNWMARGREESSGIYFDFLGAMEQDPTNQGQRNLIPESQHPMRGRSVHQVDRSVPARS